MEQKIEMPKSEANREYFLKLANMNCDNLDLKYDQEIPILEEMA